LKSWIVSIVWKIRYEKIRADDLRVI